MVTQNEHNAPFLEPISIKKRKGNEKDKTCAASLEKPAFRVRCWTTSMSEVGGSLGLCGTSARGAAPVDSTPAEGRAVQQTTGTRSRRTTLSGGTLVLTRTNESLVECRTFDNTCLNKANKREGTR